MVTICLGTVAPSRNSIGKDVIARQLREEGYCLIDLGGNITVQTLEEAFSRKTFSLLALSCPEEECLHELNFLISWAVKRSVPVLIGGTAVNVHDVAALRSALKAPFLYYSHNVSDLMTVVQKALKLEPPAMPLHGEGKPFFLFGEEKALAEEMGLWILEGNRNHVVIHERTRQWCGECPGNINRTCPLSSGYFVQRSMQESRLFVEKFRRLFLIGLPALKREEREVERKGRIAIWLAMKKLEGAFSKRFSQAVLFKLPIQCPLCPPEDCIMPLARCRRPQDQFPMHEEYNIDMMETARVIAGDRRSMEMYALLLADPFPKEEVNQDRCPESKERKAPERP